MSRKIDLGKPLSPRDRAYLQSRGRGWQIHANERAFGDDVASAEDARKFLEGKLEPEAEEELPESMTDVEFVNSLNGDELKAELEARELPKSGNKAELQERLLAALASEED